MIHFIWNPINSYRKFVALLYEKSFSGKKSDKRPPFVRKEWSMFFNNQLVL